MVHEPAYRDTNAILIATSNLDAAGHAEFVDNLISSLNESRRIVLFVVFSAQLQRVTFIKSPQLSVVDGIE